MSIYGGDEKLVQLSDTAAQVIVAVLVVGVFVAMAFEMPPDIVFLVSLVIIMLTEILSLPEVLAGFANESLITIGALFLVIGAVQKSHVMELLAKKAFGIRSSNTMGTLRLLVSLAGLSTVFNNIPLCNLMIPIVRDWARSRGIPLSHLLMPLSYTVIAGGLCTMIGTSTSLIVQGLMQEDIGYSFPFFTPGVIALPCSALLITYMIYCASIILPSRSGLIREVRDKAGDFIAEIEVLEGSAFIDHDIGTMMGRLGLQQDSVIKIRRPFGATDVEGSHHSTHSSNSPNINNTYTPNSHASVRDIQIKLIPVSASTTTRRAARGRTESDFSLAMSPDNTLDTNRIKDNTAVECASEGATGQSTASVHVGQGSMIADVEYVQQSRGAWGVPSTISPRPADDIAVNGYRPARLAVRDIEGGYVSTFNLGESGPASYTSPGALGDSSTDSGSVAGHEPGTHREDSSNEYPLTSLVGPSSRYRDIINPNQFDVVKSGDIVFIASAAEVVVKVLKSVGSERTGLNLLDSSVLDLPGFGSELIELTLSGQNPFIGKSMGECSAEFATRYKVGIISTRSRGQGQSNPIENTPTEIDHSVNDIEELDIAESAPGTGFLSFDTRSVVLAAGDMVLCLAKSSDINDLKVNKDFFVASTVGSVPPVMSLYGMVPVAVFLIMIILVATENIRMCPAALTAVGIFFIGGWLKATDVPRLIDIRLLMLMGCSISFAASMQASGLASTVARSVIQALNPSPRGALYVVYILTLFVTETMSNNAAAAIMYPLGSAVAKELGVSVIPFALTVLIAATAAFMSPIGYQTHLMVWAPGGYKFTDFVKFGFVADMLFWQITCALAPVLFPL